MKLEHNIIKLYIIKAAKWFMLIMPVYALYCTENGLADYDLLILQSIYSFSVAFMEIPSGYFADVIGRKKTLLIGSILGTIGFAIYASTSGFIFFLLAELILGLGQSFISGADSALLFDTLEATKRKEKYLKYEGRITSFGSFAETFAAILGGFIAFEISVRAVFATQALVAFIAVPAAFLLIEPPRTGKKVSPSLKHIISIGKNALFENKALSSTIIMSSVIGTATLSMAWITLIYLSNYHNLTESEITPVWVALNVTVASVAFFAEKIRKLMGNYYTMLSIAILIPMGYFLLGFTGFIGGITVLLGFYFVRGYATPVLKDFINNNCESNVRATVLSVRSLIIRISFAVIAPILGFIFKSSGMQTGLMYFAIPLLILSIFAFRYIRKYKAYDFT